MTQYAIVAIGYNRPCSMERLLKSLAQADYDGDQVSVKGIYSAEANAELDQQMNSKIHYIGLDGISVMDVGKEAKQSLYCLTMVLPNSNLTDPQF